MAIDSIKVSALTDAQTPLVGDELVYIVQDGISVQTTTDQFGIGDPVPEATEIDLGIVRYATSDMITALSGSGVVRAHQLPEVIPLQQVALSVFDYALTSADKFSYFSCNEQTQQTTIHLPEATTSTFEQGDVIYFEQRSDHKVKLKVDLGNTFVLNNTSYFDNTTAEKFAIIGITFTSSTEATVFGERAITPAS